jgi:beta-1,4-N-acetylglucosaminyltransferase
VTVGATASFRALIDAVTSKEFLETFLDLGYTHLIIQCGPDFEYAMANKLSGNEVEVLQQEHKLVVTLFGFNAYGLGKEMKGCKMRPGKSREGIVITHAGKLSIVLRALVSSHQAMVL